MEKIHNTQHISSLVRKENITWKVTFIEMEYDKYYIQLFEARHGHKDSYPRYDKFVCLYVAKSYFAAISKFKDLVFMTESEFKEIKKDVNKQ